jgi:uncharacterized phage protein (TIGR01671 family)
MTREIKFRAWDKVHNKMVTPIALGFLSNEVVTSDSALEIGKHCELMQYTGWNDKNGKEMYEGDIVKTNYYTGTPGNFKRIVGKIVYHFPAFVVEGINQYEGMREKLHGLSEVIGNIYQHQNLLQP